MNVLQYAKESMFVIYSFLASLLTSFIITNSQTKQNKNRLFKRSKTETNKNKNIIDLTCGNCNCCESLLALVECKILLTVLKTLAL